MSNPPWIGGIATRTLRQHLVLIPMMLAFDWAAAAIQHMPKPFLTAMIGTALIVLGVTIAVVVFEFAAFVLLAALALASAVFLEPRHAERGHGAHIRRTMKS